MSEPGDVVGTDFIVIVWEEEASHLEIDTFRVCTRADSVTGYVSVSPRKRKVYTRVHLLTNFLKFPSSEHFIYFNV
jgi:hypothetical protein